MGLRGQSSRLGFGLMWVSRMSRHSICVALQAPTGSAELWDRWRTGYGEASMHTEATPEGPMWQATF